MIFSSEIDNLLHCLSYTARRKLSVMKINRLIRYLAGVLLCTLMYQGSLLAQATHVDDLYAEFISHYVELCDDGGAQYVLKIKVTNPYNNSCKLRLWSENDDGTWSAKPVPVPQNPDGVESIVEANQYVPRVTEGTHRICPIVLSRVYIGDGDGSDMSKIYYYNDVADTLKMDVYAYPKPKLLCDMIGATGRLCSLDTVLVAEYVEGDIYNWTVTSNVPMLRNEVDGNKSYLKSSAPATLSVQLVQSRGPECDSRPLSMPVNMFSTATGIIEKIDENGSPEEVRVCSLYDDPAATFIANATIDGDYAPFDLVLTNGNVSKGLGNGESEIEVYQPTAAVLGISYIRDANGCHSNPKDVSGEIVVSDRTPKPSFPKDTVYIEVSRENRYHTICVDNYAEGNEAQWKIDNVSKDFDRLYDIMFDGTKRRSCCNVTSTVNVPFVLDYTETNLEGQECAVKLKLNIKPTVKFYLPTAMSPNGDGKNDALIIEGIYPENELYVFDMKGKLVYEKLNYRNDWKAEDLEDGHYVYVLKSSGETYKQVLAIKRNPWSTKK